MKLKRIITFIKDQEKIRNQNIENQIENHNTINVNWMIKLKTTKTFTKGSKKKNEIQRMRTTLENIIFDKLKLNDKIKNK